MSIKCELMLDDSIGVKNKNEYKNDLNRTDCSKV